jgi:hypothetical protein
MSTTVKKAPKNSTELTEELMNTFAKVQNGEITAENAASLSRIADTTIRTVKADIMYRKLIGSKRKIKFLE